jgi:hypothetical protein
MNSAYTEPNSEHRSPPEAESESQAKRVGGKDIYDWALYELSSARRVEVSSGIDTSDLRQQIVFALQRDLYEWLGDDDLTI